jgi:hypothetical protein
MDAITDDELATLLRDTDPLVHPVDLEQAASLARGRPAPA